MGFFKKIKKAFKKTLGTASGGLIGDDGTPKAADAGVPQVAPAAPAAAVEAPKETDSEADTADTEASRKAAKAKGKRSLSVQRQSGSGLNL